MPRWNIVFGTKSAAYVPFRRAKCADYFDTFVRKLVALRPKDKDAIEFKFSSQAKELFEAWYHSKRPRLTDGLVANFEIRVLEVVKKYAVLLAFLNHRRTVALEDMQMAMLFGSYFMTTCKRLVRQEIYENKFDAQCQKVVKAMERLGEMRSDATQRKIMRSSNLNKQDFERCVETMLAKGIVQKVVNSRTGAMSYAMIGGG